MKISYWRWGKKRLAHIQFSDGRAPRAIRDVRKIIHENGLIFIISKNETIIAHDRDVKSVTVDPFKPREIKAGEL